MSKEGNVGDILRRYTRPFRGLHSGFCFDLGLRRDLKYKSQTYKIVCGGEGAALISPCKPMVR